MLDTNISEALVALRDLGVKPLPRRRLDERCRTALQREIEREQHRRPRRGFSPRRGVTLAVSISVLGLLGGVGYAALSSPAQVSAGIDCHANAALNGSGTIAPVDGRPPTQICAQLWAQGAVSDGTHSPPAPLHACVDPNGGNAIHVFASAESNVCAQLGLREDPTAGTDRAAQQYARFSTKLTRWLDATSCPSLSQARDAVREDLASAGVGDWKVISRGVYNAKNPCASVAISSDARTVTIIPIGG